MNPLWYRIFRNRGFGSLFYRRLNFFNPFNRTNSESLLSHIRLRFQNSYALYVNPLRNFRVSVFRFSGASPLRYQTAFTDIMARGVSLSLLQAFFDAPNRYDYPIRDNRRIGEERKLRPFDALRFSPQAILHYFDIIPQRQRL